MRFCTTCQASKHEEGGQSPKGFRGWRCKGCVDKKSESIYKSKTGRAYDVRKLLAYLSEKDKQKESV